LIEKKAWRLLLTAIIVSVSAGLYLLANHFGKIFGAWNIELPLDGRIPFVPKAIFIYLLIFPFLAAPIFLVKKHRDFFHVIAVYFLLVLSSVSAFMLLPTTMARPMAPEFGVTGFLFWLMRQVDGPHNLFPSLHVSSVFYIALVIGRFCRAAIMSSIFCAVLISLSTLLVKQHLILDVAGGLVFGIGAYIAFWVINARRAS